ncbi:DUF3995 domain-containing protein [Oceanobacillus neutriphilus]|uniref:DUF3995 domain-containing protein n=1 Tax=Oceanobacillus neutriphilus TaxID=531815 RepID=A0ABQ2P299_9BACI|nr:DUF3995 domain-containing protein [Oceanobacillus neutriphilus]GGP16133.1 hypothetical protein GCM10011346_46890 [Oceanobacillus neutriphilus]
MKYKRSLDFLGYAAFIWSVLFGLIHVYWAFGGILLFDGQSMKIGSLLFFINIAAIILSVLAAILAFAFVQAWGKKIPSWMLLSAAGTACGVLGIRGSVGIWQTFQLSINDIPLILLIFEPLFVAGGILYGALAVVYRLSQQRNIKV